MGTLASPTGAQIALPFYVQFKNEQEALEYAKEYLEPFNILGKTACIIWDSEVGKQLLSTFVLSDEALAFLVARDLYGVQRPFLLTQVFTFMLCFYTLHIFVYKGDSIVFLIALPILAGMAIYSAFGWNKLAIYLNEYHADVMAANLSVMHTKGGQEYYLKFLTRNRILRNLVNGGDKLFSPIGEVKMSIAKYVSRYDGINDVSSDNDQLTLSILGDDLAQ
uniref:ABC transmembrane type-1 domain-containing protein n=1 Tax=Meloidogyne hapla TaxID=6305 RepID=A0A1I8BRG6_MELHA